MTFVAPLLLVALALLAPVAIAFLVRHRRDVVRVPSILLYRLAGARVVPQARFRNVRRWVALALCLAGVTALVFAAARPSAKSRSETVAIVIDVSASMAAGGGKTPLARAKSFAARRIASGGPRDRYALIAAGATARRIAGPVAPGPELEEALERLTVEKGTSDVPGAVELAHTLVSRAPGPRILVLGDGGSTFERPRGSDVPIAARTFPPLARDDLGIAGLTSRAADGRDDERDVTVEVATSSEKARRARVTLTADGRPILDRVVDVPAKGDTEVRARVVASASRVEAVVAPADGIPDALALDDRAELTEKGRAQVGVLLVVPPSESQGAAAFFVEKAIAAAGARVVGQTTPALDDPKLEGADVMVAVGAGPNRALDLPALYVHALGGVLPVSGPKSLEGDLAHLRSVEARDPLLRGVSLDGVTIEHATAFKLPEGARSLVDLDGGSVVAAGGAGRRRFVYLGIDPARSDLALRVAFPVLVANALHHLGGASDVVIAETVARSEIALADAPEGDVAEEPVPRWRFNVAPGVLVALIGALLLALEAWAWRKGWANA